MEPTIFTILNKKPKRLTQRCYDSESLKYLIGFRVGIIAILDLCYQGYPVHGMMFSCISCFYLPDARSATNTSVADSQKHLWTSLNILYWTKSPLVEKLSYFVLKVYGIKAQQTASVKLRGSSIHLGVFLVYFGSRRYSASQSQFSLYFP